MQCEVVMQHKHLRFGNGFHVALGDANSQAAQMTLAPGEKEGDPDNYHKGADQWLFIVSGTGKATVNGETISLRAGTIVLIWNGCKWRFYRHFPCFLKSRSLFGGINGQRRS
jgi:mannose-6-phosphate isomerase-like protein (cupin superfamily)